MRGGRANNDGFGRGTRRGQQQQQPRNGLRQAVMAADLDYAGGRQIQQHIQVSQHLQGQNQAQSVPKRIAASIRPEDCAVVSIKNLHYNITPSDLVDAVNHLNGSKPPLNLPMPQIEYDNSGRSAGSALWYIPAHADALRVAHLLHGEVLDGQGISASVLSHGVGAAAGAVSVPHIKAAPAAGPAGAFQHGLGVAKSGRVAQQNGGIAKKKTLSQRLGPPTVISRLGPKKGEVLNRLGPKLREPGILGRLGLKPGSNSSAAKDARRGRVARK